ncbi:MAG: thioesterase domain-containing protein [Candidatus Tectomicrobia bacterium]
MPDLNADKSTITQRIQNLTPEKRQLLERLLHKQHGDPTHRASSFVMALQPSGSQPPLFLLPPIMGTIFPYYPLAHLLGTSHPLYGVLPLGIDGEAAPHTRIEDMAAHAIAAMRTLQPEGPYFLGGYSFGGLVAFEIARQLQDAQQHVELLALFDAWSPCAMPTSRLVETWWVGLEVGLGIWSYIYDYMALLLTSTFRQRPPATTWQPRTWKQLRHMWPFSTQRRSVDMADAQPGIFKSLAAQVPALLPMFRIFIANLRALQHYMPQPYPHRITLFRTQSQLTRLHREPAQGWQQLTSDNVEVHWVEGKHLTMLRAAHARSLAEKLGACLQKTTLS